MMEDKLDESSNFKVIERQDFRGRLIVGNTKGFIRDKLSMNGRKMTSGQGSQSPTQALTLKGQLQNNKDDKR
jgi:hypothetical protein